MGAIRTPTSDHISAIEDSRRWTGFRHRPDDIFISTPPKSGTTWMQGIVSSLLWPDGDAPGALGTRSPWVDFRLRPVADIFEALDAQPHRRFIKTHSPADCTPIFDECHYVVVYRDGRDALMSWGNHRDAMRPELFDMLNESAARDGIEPMARSWDGDWSALLDEWLAGQSSIRHLSSWWPLRHEPFVTFVHYNDLTADLNGEMDRLAAALDLHIDDALWPGVVARCRLDEIRETARAEGHYEIGFEGGADAFFNTGTNERWRGVLTDEQLDRYDRHVADGLTADAAEWLRHGSIALRRRPDE